MSQTQARTQYDHARTRSRNQHWEMISDFSFALSQLIAVDGGSARRFRARSRAKESVEDIPPTALEIIEDMWSEIFPGRQLDWEDWSPVVKNEKGEIQSYTANQMSDGERAALYLMAKVLLAEPNQVMVIDEPETHFHSHLAVRLWDALQHSRSDLRFVYLTHDVPFALSREPATFCWADPRSGLSPVDVNKGLPPKFDAQTGVPYPSAISRAALFSVRVRIAHLTTSSTPPGSGVETPLFLPVGSCDPCADLFVR